MTCAQGLLRLLWGGGPKLECYGTAKAVRCRFLIGNGNASAQFEITLKVVLDRCNIFSICEEIFHNTCKVLF